MESDALNVMSLMMDRAPYTDKTMYLFHKDPIAHLNPYTK